MKTEFDTPRQKMINLMYVVFIALLATRVPPEDTPTPVPQQKQLLQSLQQEAEPHVIKTTGARPASAVTLPGSAVISPVRTRVLYAGIDNPIQIAVSGAARSALHATISVGILTQSDSCWIARPPNTATEVEITVSVHAADKQLKTIQKCTLSVRPLPPPLPYLIYSDKKGEIHHVAGGLISKQALANLKEIRASATDGLLDIQYTLIGFDVIFIDSMGNGVPEPAEGNNFSLRQQTRIRELSPGNRFYISRITACGPDGVVHSLPSLTITVN